MKKIREIVNEERFRKKIDLNIFKKILKNNLNIKNEKILIIGDKGYKDSLISPILTNAYSLAAEELNLNYETIYQNFKGRGENADTIVIKKIKELPKKSVIILNMSNRIGRLEGIGLSFRKYAAKQEHRFISSSSLGTIRNENLKLVLNCMNIDYEKAETETEKIRKTLTKAKKIQVTTKNGTDITIDVEGIEGKKATGIYKNPGDGGNLPGTESYIAPNRNKVNGTLVIDGSARLKDETILIKNPIIIEIKDGIAINIKSNNFESKKLLETLRWAHNKSLHPENVWKIGEFGIGLNKKAKIIGATIIDEKTYGTCHFALGSNSWFGGEIKSIIHLDHVIRNPTIKIDGKILKY